jgi:hypothetical protein
MATGLWALGKSCTLPSLLLCFLVLVAQFEVLHLKGPYQAERTFLHGVRKGPVSFPSFPITFIEKTVLPSSYVLGTFVKNQLTVHVGFLPGLHPDLCLPFVFWEDFM